MFLQVSLCRKSAVAIKTLEPFVNFLYMYLKQSRRWKCFLTTLANIFTLDISGMKCFLMPTLIAFLGKLDAPFRTRDLILIMSWNMSSQIVFSTERLVTHIAWKLDVLMNLHMSVFVTPLLKGLSTCLTVKYSDPRRKIRINFLWNKAIS